MDRTTQLILDDLHNSPINSPSDPRAIRDTPSYDAVLKAIDISNGSPAEYFPLTTFGGKLTVTKFVGGIYYARRNDNDSGLELVIPSEDLNNLFVDLRDATDENGDYLPSANGKKSLIPGTRDFDRTFHTRLTQNPGGLDRLLWEHMFGLMQGCGLQCVVSELEAKLAFADLVQETEVVDEDE